MTAVRCAHGLLDQQEGRRPMLVEERASESEHASRDRVVRSPSAAPCGRRVTDRLPPTERTPKPPATAPARSEATRTNADQTNAHRRHPRHPQRRARRCTSRAPQHVARCSSDTQDPRARRPRTSSAPGPERRDPRAPPTTLRTMRRTSSAPGPERRHPRAPPTTLRTMRHARVARPPASVRESSGCRRRDRGSLLGSAQDVSWAASRSTSLRRSSCRHVLRRIGMPLGALTEEQGAQQCSSARAGHGPCVDERRKPWRDRRSASD